MLFVSLTKYTDFCTLIKEQQTKYNNLLKKKTCNVNRIILLIIFNLLIINF